MFGLFVKWYPFYAFYLYFPAIAMIGDCTERYGGEDFVKMETAAKFRRSDRRMPLLAWHHVRAMFLLDRHSLTQRSVFTDSAGVQRTQSILSC